MRVKKKKLLDLISALIEGNHGAVEENLSVFAGPEDARSVIISNGLKIRHTDSGLVYTVDRVLFAPSGKPEIRCTRPGLSIVITADEFKDYERH